MMRFIIKEEKTEKILLQDDIENFDVVFTQVNGKQNEACIVVKRHKSK